MKKIRFAKAYTHQGRTYQAGWVAEFRDSVVDQLVLAGAGNEVSPSVRCLKYTPAAKMTVECVTDLDDAVESAPKGATRETPKTNTKIKE